MGLFDTHAQKYAKYNSELVGLARQILSHQNLAKKFLGKNNILMAGRETREAQHKINQARGMAKDLEKVCKKLNAPLPGVARVLLYEMQQEKGIRKQVRHEGVKA